MTFLAIIYAAHISRIYVYALIDYTGLSTHEASYTCSGPQQTNLCLQAAITTTANIERSVCNFDVVVMVWLV